MNRQMHLDGNEVDFERSLAELSPAITSGMETVPSRELSARVGRASARRKARTWPACALLLAAGMAGAMFLRSSPPTEVVYVPAETAAPAELEEAVRAMASATPEQTLVLSSGMVVLTDPETPRKIVFVNGGPGEVRMDIVPESWEVYDH